MYLLVGLGNPGKKYERTRHNAGFIFMDYLAGKNGLGFKYSKWQAGLVKARLWQAPLILAKPDTFMNLSGTAVRRIVDFFQIPHEKIIVIHDDLDLDLGRIKIAINRGDGGHNGVGSIIEHLSSKNFSRIRVGIGRPGPYLSSSQYVLSHLSDDEYAILTARLEDIEEGVRLIIKEGVSSAMNKINPVSRPK